MDRLYWYCEYGKVLIGYILLLYVWPSIIFRRYLWKKGLTFRFAFCTTVQIVLINGVVLGLGLLHILNAWIIRVIFYGPIAVSLGIPLIKQRRNAAVVVSISERRMLANGFGWKTLFFRLFGKPIEKYQEARKEYKCRRMEYLLLAFILVFGMIFFSYNAFQNNSYGCYDQYTHTQWIFKLRQGDIFANGIYPEAMHCFIYSMHILFGIKIYSCILFLAGIHISAFLVAAYCLMKDLFLCRYTPLYVLILFLTFDGCIVGEARSAMLLSMARLTWTIPQEFGLYLVFLCPLFLLRFLREDEKKRKENWIRQENLLLLSMGIAASIAVHFYVTIWIFFVCLAAVLVYLKKLLFGRKILPLFFFGLCGAVAGVTPMIIGFLTGIKLEGSLWWGIKTYYGEGGAAAEMIAEKKVVVSTESRNLLTRIFEQGYAAIFGEKMALELVATSLLILILLCVSYLFYDYKKNTGIRKPYTEKFKGYLFITIASVFSIFLYAAPFIGLPEFISVDRLFSILKMFAYAVFWIPMDFMLYHLLLRKNIKIQKASVIFICIFTYCFAYFIDFHEYLFWVLKRYNSAVSVTKEIMEKYQQESYIVISMNDERCQLETDERHEQLLDFLYYIEEGKEHYLPVEYIFLYVEKHPLRQGTIQYFTGPSWLGKKSSEYKGDPWQKWYPDAAHTEVSYQLSEQILDYPELKSSYFSTYFDVEKHAVLSSKAYYWYQDFEKKYPLKTNVFYEDDDFVCYMIHQEPGIPLNLVLEEPKI